MLGHAYALSGNRGEALEVLEELNRLSTVRYISPYYVAAIYAAPGEKDKAFEWLNKEIEDRSLSVSLLRIDQKFDPLRSDPRFTALLRRVGRAQ